MTNPQTALYEYRHMRSALDNLARAYRNLGGLDAAYDSVLVAAERILGDTK